MNKITLLALSAILALVSGCSSVKTEINKGTVSAKTFSFLDTRSRQAPGESDNRKEVHDMIQKAISNNLAVKGVTHVPTGGDVTVAYLVIVGNNVATTSLNTYFGYTDEASALVEQEHKRQTTSGQRGYFEAGTLVIDILDPKTSKVLQRRSIRAQVLRDLTEARRAERVQAIVDQALGNVPIGH